MKNLAIFTTQIVAIAATVAHADNDIIETLPIVEQDEAKVEFVIETDELQCMTEAIYFEARNQTVLGMIAIANVISNRARSPDFPSTICNVVHQGPLDGSEISLYRCQFSYFCDGQSDVFPVNDTIAEIQAVDWANLVAKRVLAGETSDWSNGSTYYHADYVTPFWSKEYEKVAVVDSHIFYIHY